MNDKLHKLKQEFLEYWTLEKLQNMTLEEYTDTKREGSFCYWLEHITRDLGSIVGGSSYKFGIYKRNSNSEVKEESNRKTDGEYAWFKKYGIDNKEEAFETVKKIIIKIAHAAQNNTLEVIDAIDLGNAYKWKIAFLYGDYNCANMFKLDALRVIASNLEITYNSKTPISYFHKAILKLKSQEEEYFTYCHALWKQYEERLIDVKKDFSKWLNKNTFESYRAYLGLTNKSIEEKLDEINDFFDDIDFFLIDPKNVNGLVSTILFMMSKKERLKNPDFIEYDSKNSNGIPKAILGKNNYIKFLKEKFDYIAPNYWIFQGNPSVYDITVALKAGHLKSWKVAVHKDKIKIGDKVIIWQTGKNAGCYALGEVTSDVSVFEEELFEQQYYVDNSNSLATERVKIKIDHYLADTPILWKDIKNIDVFNNFKAGNQGTNFSATEEEYNALLNCKKTKGAKYWLYAPGRNAEHWETFYNKNTMAIGWDKIGDINQYGSKDEIREALRIAYGGDGNKMNNVTANFEFANTVNIGDIIIAKQGRSKLLGYGIVTSDYFYDDSKESYTSCRRVDWKLKGEWGCEHSLVLKTFTDITKYKEKDGSNYYDKLMGIMNTNQIDSLVNEFTEYLETGNYARFTIKIYSSNFEIVLKTYVKSLNISNLSNPDYEFLPEVNFDKFLEKTRGEHEGKGYVHFVSFFEAKIETYRKNIPATNQILYGPPGTGKTFYLKDQLFDKYTSKQTSITKEQHFETVVSSCSWWQVIAIALLDLGKSKVSDIFEHEWIQKKASLSNSKTIRPTLWGQLQSHTINECKHVNVSSRQQPLLFNKTEDSFWEILEDEVKELVPELYDIKDSVENYNPDPDTVIKNYDFVTFHQSFAYEDFIEGIKPIAPEEGEESKDLGYAIEDGVFKKLCLRAKNDPDNKYAIFIDEINRGNVSAIFGELITLIELDKRKDAKNGMSIKLPYSKKEFSVPSNIDIYGTMNTADRSVEALDTALRRRFEFKEMMPDYAVIENEEVEGIKLSEVLKTINQRIELLIDRDHTIGHSYFVNVNTLEKLANAFNNKIVPLLQEYFYGDYGKIGLVLGNGFVEIKKNDTIDFANFKYDNANDFKIASYELNQVDKNTVIDAVLELLGKKEISE